MLDHKNCLLTYARLSEDWTEYYRFSKRFNDKLLKFNRSIEKKVVQSRDKRLFFKFMKTKLKDKTLFSDLKLDSKLLLEDHDKASALTSQFCKVFITNNGIKAEFFPKFGPKCIHFPF